MCAKAHFSDLLFGTRNAHNVPTAEKKCKNVCINRRANVLNGEKEFFALQLERSHLIYLICWAKQQKKSECVWAVYGAENR